MPLVLKGKLRNGQRGHFGYLRVKVQTNLQVKTGNFNLERVKAPGLKPDKTRNNLGPERVQARAPERVRRRRLYFAQYSA